MKALFNHLFGFFNRRMVYLNAPKPAPQEAPEGAKVEKGAEEAPRNAVEAAKRAKETAAEKKTEGAEAVKKSKVKGEVTIGKIEIGGKTIDSKELTRKDVQDSLVRLGKRGGENIRELITQVLGKEGWEKFREDYRKAGEIKDAAEWQAEWMLAQKAPEQWDSAIRSMAKGMIDKLGIPKVFAALDKLLGAGPAVTRTEAKPEQ